VLIRVLGFLGGTFIFAGIAAFIAIQWNAMNAPARVVATLGSGLAAFVLALLAWRETRYERAAAGLLLTAAALGPTGMLVAFDEYGSGGDWRVAVLATAATMAAQFGLTFGAIRRSTPLFLCILFGALFSGFRLSERGRPQPHAALRRDARRPGLHRLLHGRALRRLDRLAAHAHRVRPADDRPERSRLANRSRLRAAPAGPGLRHSLLLG
jgi:hypothetical protein